MYNEQDDMNKTHTNDGAASNQQTELEPGADLEDELCPGYDASTLKNGTRGIYFADYRNLTIAYVNEGQTIECD